MKHIKNLHLNGLESLNKEQLKILFDNQCEFIDTNNYLKNMKNWERNLIS